MRSTTEYWYKIIVTALKFNSILMNITVSALLYGTIFLPYSLVWVISTITKQCIMALSVSCATTHETSFIPRRMGPGSEAHEPVTHEHSCIVSHSCSQLEGSSPSASTGLRKVCLFLLLFSLLGLSHEIWIRSGGQLTDLKLISRPLWYLSAWAQRWD